MKIGVYKNNYVKIPRSDRSMTAAWKKWRIYENKFIEHL